MRPTVGVSWNTRSLRQTGKAYEGRETVREFFVVCQRLQRSRSQLVNEESHGCPRTK
jgi:hypothetical protein